MAQSERALARAAIRSSSSSALVMALIVVSGSAASGPISHIWKVWHWPKCWSMTSPVELVKATFMGVLSATKKRRHHRDGVGLLPNEHEVEHPDDAAVGEVDHDRKGVT